MSVFDAVDEIGAGILPSGATLDGSGARPVEYEAGVLYVWPADTAYQQADTGDTDEVRFTIRAAYVVDASAEVASMTRTRATTDALDAFVTAVGTWVRAHRGGTAYEQLAIASVDWELITHEERGVVVNLAGWTLEA